MRHTSILSLFSVLIITPAILFAESTAEMPVGLQAAYQQARHQIEIIQDKDQPTRWRAVNPNNHLSVDFDGKGILAHSLKDDWRLSMELTRLGEFDQLKPVNKPSIQIKDNRLTYDRGTIREWYINDPKGLEQGFTLDKPLAKKQLVLQFALGGDVKPKLIDKGKALQLITPQGKKLRYEGLKAWDAKGKDLNTTLQLKEQTLQLQVAVMDAVYPITIDPWLVEEQKLVADDTAAGDIFGVTVALSGDTALVGAVFDNDAGTNSGSAYIFTRSSGSTWSQQDKLTALDAASRDRFGHAVALSGDTALVGVRDDDDAGFSSGSAYVFTRSSGSTWSQQDKLTALDAAPEDSFGTSVALSGDTALVGACHDDDDATNSGSAYVFTRSGGTWSQQGKLTASDAASRDQFGSSVALSGDTALVGAIYDNDDSGSAYVFTRSGGTWSQQDKLTALDGAWRDLFSRSIALSGDTAVVGACHDDDGGTDSGSAYIFTRNGSTWSQQDKLTALDAAPEDHFGNSVALSGDTALVGADDDDDGGTDSGSAYIFTRSGSTWSQQGKLTALDAASRDWFGNSVALSGDTALVGAHSNGDGGSAYTFDLSCNTTYTLPSGQWHQISLPCDPGTNNTVAAVFGDDALGVYDTNWVLYRYSSDGYVKLSDPATDSLSQGVGYWIIQLSDGGDKTLDMPNNSTPASVTDPTGCLATAKGCFEVPLTTQDASPQWNMIGYPFKSTEKLADVHVLTKTGTCASGCDLGTAETQGLVHNQLWTYNGSGYTLVNTSDNLEPWTGYWSKTLSSAYTTVPKLLVPKP